MQELHLSLNAPVLISMHNIAAKVLRPPGTEAENFAPDEAALKELGRRMAEPTGYLNQYGWQLYDVTGGTKDWAYASRAPSATRSRPGPRTATSTASTRASSSTSTRARATAPAAACARR